MVFKRIARFIFQSVMLMGALSCVFVWLGVKPKDFVGWPLSLTIPQLAWLFLALALFAAGLVSSAISLYKSLKPTIVVREVIKEVENTLKPTTKLQIHRAAYAAGLDTEVPATDELQNAARDGLVVTVDNGLGGLLRNDPATGIRKTLEIEYSYGSGKHFTVSRRESPSGEPPTRLLLPEDTEVKRLEKELERLEVTTKERDNYKAAITSADQVINQLRVQLAETEQQPKEDKHLCAALLEIARADAAKIGERIREANQRLEFRHDSGSDPYLDVVTELWNGSIFDLINAGEISGHATYAGHQLRDDPRIIVSLEPPLLSLKRSDKLTFIVRQYLSQQVAETMQANKGRGIIIDFMNVMVPFRVLTWSNQLQAGRFRWLGPRFAIEDTERV